ncbi:hypothetical protein EYF80_047119 [Liparis tanakae]|uniref:Uncharacterized protein n=1 Tax=Liparis tanakae TaxID=230148 RepID=A0A4Z2FNH6_9TELE|nr:hypothetical protein EYF80_047119 [Liparis tanakae]
MKAFGDEEEEVFIRAVLAPPAATQQRHAGSRVPPLALTIITDVRTASETLCLSSAAVPGLLSPRVNFLASGGAEAMARPHRSSDGQVAEKERGRRGGGSSCGPSDGRFSPPPTPAHSNPIPETSGPDKPANEAFPAALPVCLSAQRRSSRASMPNATDCLRDDRTQRYPSPHPAVCQNGCNHLHL